MQMRAYMRMELIVFNQRRTRKGNKPKDANGVLFDSCNDDPDDALHGWRIYRRAASTAPWLSLKVVHVGSVQGAANYWLAWNTEQQRFSQARETARVPESMLKRVASIMRDYARDFPPGEAEAYMAEIEVQEAALA